MALSSQFARAEKTDIVTVNTAEGQVGLNTLDVVSMYPVEAGFWDRLDLSVSLGFSWDKGSNVGKYNLGADAVYRLPESITRLGLNSEITTQENENDSTRSNFTANHMVSLHAGVATKANDCAQLEHLCRYITRPSISTKRLSLTRNGQVRYELTTSSALGRLLLYAVTGTVGSVFAS